MFTFLVTRNGTLANPESISYTVAGSGTNQANAADFGGAFPGGSVDFAANVESQTQTVTIRVSGDNDVEPNEGFAVTLDGGASAVGTILNDDTETTITPLDAVQAEGNSGETLFTFLVTRNGTLANPESISYTVAGSGTNQANAADFGGAFPGGSVDFAANVESQTQTVTIRVSGDNDVEPNEGFAVTLDGGASAVGTILNDDTETTITPLDAVQAEGNSGETLFTFLVTRNGTLANPESISYTVAGSGTNQANAADFGGAFPGGSVDFAANVESQTQTVTIRVSGDNDVEPNEGFAVTLDGGSSAVGTILNDDTETTITPLDAVQAEGNSGETLFTFLVTRNGTLANPESISYTVAGSGTNQANAADFGGAFPGGSVDFAANVESQTQTVTIRVSGDNDVEPNEGFAVTLDGGASAVGTILNDDTETTITPLDAVQAEGNSGETLFTFLVTRNGTLANPESINYIFDASTTFETATVTINGVVPEPGSMLIWAGLVGAPILVHRRRSKASKAQTA